MEFMYRRGLSNRRQKSFFCCDLDRIVCRGICSKLWNHNDAFLLPDHRCADHSTICNVQTTTRRNMYSSIPACSIWMYCVESLERSVWCVLDVRSLELHGRGVRQDLFRLRLAYTTRKPETRRNIDFLRGFPLVFEVACRFGLQLFFCFFARRIRRYTAELGVHMLS
jgi:hypothetical protein